VRVGAVGAIWHERDEHVDPPADMGVSNHARSEGHRRTGCGRGCRGDLFT
jgi:hypothetical protein